MVKIFTISYPHAIPVDINLTVSGNVTVQISAPQNNQLYIKLGHLWRRHQTSFLGGIL